MKRRPWTAEDDAVLRRDYPDRDAASLARRLGRSKASVYQRARFLGLAKSDAFYASERSGRQVAGVATRGLHTRFRPGQTPANKGLRRPGYGPGRMRETQFQPGALPHTTVPIGSERIREGYVWVKRSEHLTPARRNWVSKHQAVWEAVHGPVPCGHFVRFVDGDRHNFALENLELVSRAENARTRGLNALPPELRQIHQLRGAIARQINKRRPPTPARRGRPPKHAAVTR